MAQARANALALRQSVADQLNDLQDMTGVDAEDQVAAFATAVDALGEQWDQFQADYDSFRATQPGDDARRRAWSGLNRLVGPTP